MKSGAMDRYLRTYVATMLVSLVLSLQLVAPVPAETFSEVLAVAEQGDAEAQYDLGYRYAYGKGAQQDFGEAMKWYLLAAAQGHADAQYNLGTIYAYGLGVPQDYVQAYKWFNLAAPRTDEAVRQREHIALYMTPGQIDEAQELSRWWAAADLPSVDARAYVQLSSSRSESNAKTSLTSATAKWGAFFRGRTLEITKVNLGAEGDFYRVLLPTSSLDEALEICASIKDEAGECIVAEAPQQATSPSPAFEGVPVAELPGPAPRNPIDPSLETEQFQIAPTPGNESAADEFAASCHSSCVSASGGAAYCIFYCSCALEKIEVEDLWDAVGAEEQTFQQQSLTEDVINSCRVVAERAPVEVTDPPNSEILESGLANRIVQTIAVSPDGTIVSLPTTGHLSGVAYVQLSARKEAAAALEDARRLAERFAIIIGDAVPEVHLVDLGDQGIWYRVLIPAGLASNANDLCAQIKSAGGDCIVR